ncbi:ScyD/ScyE family protein [Microterricola viridarii]|nr:ScyD/ScyE family protein [Microterricola viridarii]
MKIKLIIAASGVLALASLAVAGPASAGGRHNEPPPQAGTPVTLADGLLTPLSMAVDRDGSVYVSQNFTGTLNKVTKKGETSVVASAPGDEIGAVSVRKNTVYFAQAAQDHSRSNMMALGKRGTPTPLADIAAYESEVNPDQINTYGFIDLPQSCADQFDPTAPPFLPATYTGAIDTHAYASIALDDAIYVADAGANAILRIDYDGTISTTAVLPPAAPVTASAEIVAQFGFPACAAGYQYAFEPVPTGIALGPDGWLYVSSLPGGPEDASLGARGSVLKIDPDDGEIRTVATGFVGSTGVAVSPKTGAVYVTELFGGPNGTGQVSVVPRGADKASVLLAISTPAAIALAKGKLYLTTDAFVLGESGPEAVGKVTQVPLRGSGQGDDSHDDGGHGDHGGNGNWSGHGQNGHSGGRR